jgi:hypothetical protein
MSVAFKNISYILSEGRDLIDPLKQFYQTVVYGPPVVRGGSPGGPQADSQEESTTNIVSGTERMKNTPIHVCAKTAFVC